MRRTNNDNVRRRYKSNQKKYPEPSRKKIKSNYRISNKDVRNMRGFISEEERKRSLRESEARSRRRKERLNKMAARKNKKEKLAQGKFLIYLVFVFIIIYFIGYGIMFFSKDSIHFDTIQYGSIDEPKTAKGIIVRDETLYKSTAEGAVIYNVSDKEKVKAGKAICEIRNEENVKELENDLEDINKSILSMQENRNDLSLFYEDVKKINLQIKNVVDNSIYNFSTLNIEALNDFKLALEKKMEARNQMLLSENRGSLSELAQKKKSQEDAISNSILTLSSKNGGIVSYYTDGLEDTINVSNIDSITKEQTIMDTESVDIKNYVTKDEKVFKIVNSSEWYIVAYIPNDYIEEWNVNDDVTIYTENNTSDGQISAKVSKLEKGENESYVRLVITKDILDYIDSRSINFEISHSKIGLKIPSSAVVSKTMLKIPKQYINEDYVIKISGDNKDNIIIENSGSDEEGNFIYTPQKEGVLKLGDKIQNPNSLDDVYEVKDVLNIKGIYIINSGIAEFKTLNVEDAVENNTHIIIKPEKNPKIRLYDRVLTDTENIEAEKMVYN